MEQTKLKTRVVRQKEFQCQRKKKLSKESKTTITAAIPHI
jgi:hypothetical protein